MSIKVGLISLGCPKNQVDSEMMLAKLNAAGYEIVDDAYSADIVVINTQQCSPPARNSRKRKSRLPKPLSAGKKDKMSNGHLPHLISNSSIDESCRTYREP